eukprot:TRINITY_DN25_c0_g1_i4.p1 TRINITY_DN25_c0_g1~~TRINITY_DN25_c0_g1_i4.p1  ORF type:complete len:147 (-),score=45.93 TRINITY_DN25_c0_g1_i4:27-467(-)
MIRLTSFSLLLLTKFDKDGSGQLEKPEFHKAWGFLGLKGEKAEIDLAFASVDVDASGIVDKSEFMKAIKSSRLTELSLTVLLEQMDGHLEGLESFFDDYKAKVEEAKLQASANLEAQEAAYKRFQATAKRRRLMKKEKVPTAWPLV